MKKEVNFLTENSQDNDKQLSFKEQILRDLANARKEQQSPSHLDGFPPSEERNITETNKDFSLSENLQKDQFSRETVPGNEPPVVPASKETKADSQTTTESTQLNPNKLTRVPVEISYQSKKEPTNEEETLARTATYRRTDVDKGDSLSRSVKDHLHFLYLLSEKALHLS